MTLPDNVRLKDLKDRKGHLCHGGSWGEGDFPICGCGASLSELPDFMDRLGTSGYVAPYPAAAGYVPGHAPELNGGDPPDAVRGAIEPAAPPPPFTHASGEPCWGCQSCFANILDEEDMDDPMAEADRVEAIGREVAERHGAPDMSPAVPVIDPTQPYGPAEVERAILDANRRLELGLKHEANLITAAEQLKIEYELAYAKAIERSTGGAADIRKANAVLACERQYRAWHEALAARDAMKSVTHTLRSTVSALQSVGRSVGVSYVAPQGRGR